MYDLLKESRGIAKQTRCAICGCDPCSFCNSHSIPQFSLKKIALNGKILIPSTLAMEEISVFDTEKGISNTWTFHSICRNCDSTVFSDYENMEALKKPLTNAMMAEIALKDILLQLYKRSVEKQMYSLLQQNHDNPIVNKEELDEMQDLDIKDYDFEKKRALKIIQRNLKSGYHLMYWKKLPYVISLSIQSAVAIYKGISGRIINDLFDFSADIRIENLHIGAFPLDNESIVYAFYHKDDRKYVQFEREFSRLGEVDKLKYIVFLALKYTENICTSPLLGNIFRSNEALIQLACEALEAPHYGIGSITEHIMYTPIQIEQIPNLLAEEYSLTRLQEKDENAGMV